MRFDSSMFLRGYNPTPIEPESNALLRGIQMQGARQGNALNALKLQAAQQQMAEQRQAAERQQAIEGAYRNALETPLDQAGAAGMTRPTPANAAAMGQMQPRLNQQKLAEGLMPYDPIAAAKLLMPQPRKLMNVGPGGSVIDESGKVVYRADFKPEPAKLPAIGELQAYRDQLPPGDPRRREVQALIDNQTRPPKFATPGAGPVAAPPKPLPASALKMVQESMDRIGIASSVNADLAAVEQQIASGKLKFGPISNLANAGLNMAGLSTEESRNFASFKSTLERLRNESLRLNTGVQTDGDAQRAWNELFQNINDTGLVQQRLREIQGINKRGADLQRLRADDIRANYGAPPVDAAAYETQPPALSVPPKPAAAPTRGPAVGTVEGGYRFKGGDPSKSSSWERVQ